MSSPYTIRLKILLPCAAVWALVTIIAGCQGKTLVDDNPVFAAAPPRGSLSNKSSVVSIDPAEDSDIRAVSLTKSSTLLTGNSVVAEVNGSPIFVDDLIGSVRLAVESDPSIPAEQKQQIMYAQIRKRIDGYVEQEIVLQALNKAIPEDRRALIAESLEEPFQEVVSKIKADSNVETDAELNEILAEQGLSIDLLRESFVRVQKVQGYLSTLATPPGEIDRPELVEYYLAHQDEFTNTERVRWQEITVDFSAHEGRDGAEDIMAKVVKELQSGADFADVAVKYSTALSAEKRGDMGWLERGGLADKELEKRLFELKPGQMTKVIVRDDRFDLFRVVDHQFAQTSPLKDVQQEIEQKIKQQTMQASRKAALDELRDKSSVVTIFDEDDSAPEKTSPFYGI